MKMKGVAALSGQQRTVRENNAAGKSGNGVKSAAMA
jgi:hypothetical protein